MKNTTQLRSDRLFIWLLVESHRENGVASGLNQCSELSLSHTDFLMEVGSTIKLLKVVEVNGDRSTMLVRCDEVTFAVDTLNCQVGVV